MPSRDLADELTSLTCELIRIPSTQSRPAEISRCADFIEEWFSRHGLPFSRTANQGVPIFTALPGSTPCPMLLMSHFDVVEGKTEQFVPQIRDGRLFGRGAIDDKYAVPPSSILYREACNRFKQQGIPLSSLPLGLLITGDEEAGGHNGAGHVAEYLHPGYFLALDGGHPERIIIREKGIIALTLTARGKGSHAARPWLGDSGFDRLVNDYQQMKALFSASAPDHWHPTMVLSNCHSGSGATNVVPDLATATFDIRYTEKDDPRQLVAAIGELIESEMDVSYIEPVFDGGNSPVTQLLAELSGASLSVEHGASDARFFSQKGISGAVWGADGEMSQHSDHEHLVLDSMFQVYDVLEELINALIV